MSLPAKPSITVLHDLPGRLRVGLSHAPRDAQKMKAAVLDHPGFRSIQYSDVTRSILVLYDHAIVTRQEILFRIALFISLDYGTVPVRILVAPERQGTSDSATLSAMLLIGALAVRWTRKDQRVTMPMELAAGLSTTYAVLDHGWREVRERGYFDPEVLSVGYLISAFLRGNFLKASAVTWLMTFGRHLLETPRGNIEVRPVEIKGRAGEAPRYEVMVGPDLDTSDGVRMVDALKGFVRYALTGGASHGRRNLMDEFRDVSRLHGEVLEGLGRMPHGIPMRFK
jgi:hypothetical protein